MLRGSGTFCPFALGAGMDVLHRTGLPVIEGGRVGAQKAA